MSMKEPKILGLCTMFIFASCKNFLDSDTFVLVDVQDDPGRQNEIEKLNISDQKYYLSFLSDNGKILGKSVSALDKTVYTELSHKVVKTNEKRRIKRAPKIKAG